MASPPPGSALSIGGGHGYPPFAPYKKAPVPPSVPETINYGREIRRTQKALLPSKPATAPPKAARPRPNQKTADYKMTTQGWQAHVRCLRRHNAVLTDRMERLSRPTRRQILCMWRQHADHLSPEMVLRLKELLTADVPPFRPDQAYQFFINQNKTKKMKAQGGKGAKKDLLAMCGDRRFVWARNATVALARGIQQKLSRPGCFVLADGMLRLSNIILEELCGYVRMRPPSRRSRNPKSKFILEMSDRVAVWIDEILSESDERMLMMDFDEDDEVNQCYAEDAAKAGLLSHVAAATGLSPGAVSAAASTVESVAAGASRNSVATSAQSGSVKATSATSTPAAPTPSATSVKTPDAKTPDAKTPSETSAGPSATPGTTSVASPGATSPSGTDGKASPGSPNPDAAVIHVDEPIYIDVGYADEFLNMMAGKGRRLMPPKPAYTKFQGEMLAAFKLLTDTMYRNGKKKVVEYGKFSQTNKQAADELRQTNSLDASDYNNAVAEAINKNLTDQVKSVTPASCQSEMKDIIDICSKYLAQNAEYNKDKGPAFQYLIKKMREQPMEDLAQKGTTKLTMGEAAKILEEAKGLNTDHDDPNLSQSIYESFSKLVKDVPPESKEGMPETLDLTSKYVSQAIVDKSERGPAFDKMIEVLEKKPNNPFVPSIPELAKNFNAAQALKTAPGLKSSNPNPETAPQFAEALHREVDPQTPPDMREDMNDVIKRSADYLSGYSRDRGQAKEILVKMLNDNATKEAAKRNDVNMSYGDSAKEIEASPILTPFLPMKDIKEEMGKKFDKDVTAATPRELKGAMKSLVNDAAGELSQNLALKSGAGGERYPRDLLAAAAKALGDKHLFKSGPYSMTFGEAGENIKLSGKFEESSDPKVTALSKEIATVFKQGISDLMTPETVKLLAPTMDAACLHLAKEGNQMGEALDHLVGLMMAQGDAPLAKVQGSPLSFADAAQKIQAADSLKNDKVDKGTYETIRSKLNDLVKKNPEPKYDKNMPAVIDEVSKFLAVSSEGFAPGAGFGPGGGPGGGGGSGGFLLGPDGKPILGADGKPIPLGADGKPRTMIGADGVAVMVGADGKPILGADGKPIRIGADGQPIIVGADGKPITGGSFLLGADGKPILGADGKPIPLGADGKPRTMIGADGVAVLVGADGKPILGADGKPIRVGADGQPIIVGADGKPITGGSFLLGADGKPILGADGKPIPLGADGKPRTMIGADGVAVLVGADGKPVLGADGKPIRIGADGKPIIVGADGKPITGGAAGGSFLLGADGKPILGADGKPIPLGADGKPRTMIGADGVAVLVGADGKPVLGADGKPIRIGADGKPIIVGADGKPITGGAAGGSFLLGADGKPILGADGKPIPLGADGKPRTMIGADGVAVLVGADGKPVLGADGKPIRIGADGKPIIIGADGKPITGGAAGGSFLLGADGKPILGADGKPIPLGADGKPRTIIGADGVAVLVGADGKPVLGADGKPIRIGADGKPIIVGADGKPITGGAAGGSGADGKPILGADGKPIPLGADGKPRTMIGADGVAVLVGADGKPVLGADGKPIRIGADGKPIIVGADGKPITGGAAGGSFLLGADGKPILGADGKPIPLGPDGKPRTMIGADGVAVLVGADGKPILGADGKPIRIGADGKPIIVGADGKPIALASSGQPRIGAGDKEDEMDEEREKRLADVRRRLASGERPLVHDAEHTKALNLLQGALRARGGETFYKQGQYEITNAQAADVLNTRPNIDKAIKEAPETDRLARKFERRLSNVVEGITPPELRDAMTDVVIESARDVAEYFLSKNYGTAVKEGLITGMQKRGNEILVETGKNAETFFFAAQRLKLANTLETSEAYPKVAREIAKNLDDCLKCRPMPRRLAGTMQGHVKHVAKYLSGEISKPNAKIEAYIALLGEMEAAGNNHLVEGKIPMSNKDAAAYLRSLTSFEDNINRPDPNLKMAIEGKMKSLLANLPPAGYTHADMDQVISEQANLLTSYIGLQAEKTVILDKLLEEMEYQNTAMILRHGTIRKSYFDASELLHGKNANQLQSAQTPDPVVTRKLQIKLTNLIKHIELTPSQKPLLSALVDEISNYLAINLLEPQIIKVCKCMKSVFVQCELWCEEILRRVARPCCSCSRHVSAQGLGDLGQAVAHPGPGLQIDVKQCPSMSHKQSSPTPFCPAEKTPMVCPHSHSTVHFMYSAPHFDSSASQLTPTRLAVDVDTTLSESFRTKQPTVNLVQLLPTQTPWTETACLTSPESTSTGLTSRKTSKSAPGMPSKTTSKIVDKTTKSKTTISSSPSERLPQAPFWQTTTTMPMYAIRHSRRRRRRVLIPPPSSLELDRSLKKIHIAPAKINIRSYPDCSSRNSPHNSLSLVTTDQLSDLHAMMVSLMWNVRAWRDWLQEIIDRALAYQPDSSTPKDELEKQWVSYQKRVMKEAIQWRQYNLFSRQLTLRLALRYRDRQIVSPTRATEQTQTYMHHQREMLDIIEMFNKWTQWLMVILKGTETLQSQPDSNTSLIDLCWNHFKTKVEENLQDWIIYNDFLKTCWESKYSSIMTAWTREGPVWVVSAWGAVPSGAVPAGVFEGEVMWIARTSHNAEVLPAALLPSKHSCLVYADGAVHEYSKYQVMCNAAVKWVPWRAGAGGAVGTRAVRVAPGVHVGRVEYHGQHFVGAVLAPLQHCHVVIHERPYSFRNYELLVLSELTLDTSSVPTTSQA